MPANRPEIAVIGAGIVGLAAADALLERGEQVVVYDVGPPGHGQSAGEARIFRHAHDDPRLVRLAVESRELWRGMEARFGEELVSPDGGVSIGESALERLLTLEELDVAAHKLDENELHKRMPLLAEFDGDAVLDEGAGSIRTRAAISLLSDRVGDALVPGEVLAVRPSGNGKVEVRTGADSSEYSRVIVCAGRGTAALARGAGRSLPIALACHMRCTFGVSGDPPERISTFQDGAGVWGETGIYAAPQPGNARFAVGLAETMEVNEDGAVVDPARFAEHEARVRAYVAKALPGLVPDPVELLHCWVTELPWSADAFAIWEHEGIVLTGGHNLWKMAPVLGEALAEAALGEGVREEMRPEARLGDGA